MNYVLVTAAHNEEALIRGTLDSVITQTRLPNRWMIVDDGSSDQTAKIVASYAERFSWITLVRKPRPEGRSFAGKANAVNDAVAQLADVEFEVLGNLDADITFDRDYMEFILQKFSDDPELGVAGTPFTQDGGYDSTRDSFEGENYVAGPCQMFRRECFRDIGGYVANAAGGVDWIAVMTARLKGWTVRSFSDKRYHHHRSMGTAGRSEFAALFSYGEKDYYLGNSPVWQLFRVVYRATKRPYLSGGVALGSGFLWAAARRVQRPISRELMRFHRAEQMKKLKKILRSVARLQKVDSFRLTPERENTGVSVPR